MYFVSVWFRTKCSQRDVKPNENLNWISSRKFEQRFEQSKRYDTAKSERRIMASTSERRWGLERTDRTRSLISLWTASKEECKAVWRRFCRFEPRRSSTHWCKSCLYKGIWSYSEENGRSNSSIKE